MTRATPLASQPSTVFMSRMPPPSCTGIVTRCRIASTASAFIGLPAKAPSRSTTWSHSKPCASKIASLRRRIVAEDRGLRPCRPGPGARSGRPSGRSPGNRITGRQLQEVRDQRKAELLALLRMELRAGDVVARDDGGERAAVVGQRRRPRPVSRRRARRSARNRRGARPAPVAMPSSSGCSRCGCRVFQPICGIFSAGVAPARSA